MALTLNMYHFTIFAFLYLFVQLPWFIGWLIKGAISMRPAFSLSVLPNLAKRLCEVVARYRLRPFKHQPLLQASSVRLLKLDKWELGLLYCSLQSFPLETCPPYTALSYTWADSSFSVIAWILNLYRKVRTFWARFGAEVNRDRKPSFESMILSSVSDPLEDKTNNNLRQSLQTRLIVCNNQALRVTQNLYDALVSIPRSGEPIESYWWIDQICIDQSNVAEKNIQVPMMGQIYRRASNVAAWLGTPWFFERWTPDAVFQRWEGAPFEEGNTTGRFWYHDWDLIRGHISLLVTFGRAWFQRVWIVQELVLAKKLTFFLGKRSIKTDDLVGAARRFDNYFNFQSFHMVQPIRTRAIVEIFDARNTFDIATGWSLERWISISRGRQASERKDFLFAGMGLLSECERSRLQVDYSKTAQEVFVAVTQSLLDDTGAEALCLSDRGGYSRHWMSQGQNSWEVNMDYATLHAPFPRSYFSADPSQYPPKPVINQTKTTSLLHVQGIVLDKIEKVCDVSMIFTTLDVNDFSGIALAVGDCYSWSGEHSLTAIARTLTTNQCRRDGLSSDHVTQSLVRLITTIAIGVGFDGNIIDVDEWPEVVWSHLGDADDAPRKVGYHNSYQDLRKAFPDHDWKTVWNSIDRHSTWDEVLSHPVLLNGRVPPPTDKYIPVLRAFVDGRHLFVTSKGLIGITSSSTEVGDEVAILQGSRVPFILSQASQYRKPVLELKKHVKSLRELADSFEVVLDVVELAQSKGKAPDAEKLDRFKDVLRDKVTQHFLNWTERSDGIVFKGEAYVHGLMNGEITNLMTKDESLSWKELIIC